MISKSQKTESIFHAIEIKDILAMMFLMDGLVKTINEQYKYLEEHKDLLDDYWVKEYTKEYPTLIEAYKILSTLGFVSTISLSEGIEIS